MVNRTVDGLIGEIKGLSRKRISVSQLEPVLDEVRAHLDASIRSRVELGETLEDAETQSIASFGDVDEFVSKMVDSHGVHKDSWFDRRVARALLATAILMPAALGILIAKKLDGSWLMVIWLIAMFGLAAWVSVTSWKARRPQFLPLLMAGSILVPLMAIALSFGDLGDSHFSLAIGLTRSTTERALVTSTTALKHTYDDEAAFKAAMERYCFKRNPADPYMKPTWNQDFSYCAPGSIVTRADSAYAAIKKNNPAMVLDSLELDRAASKEESNAAWAHWTPIVFNRLAMERETLGQTSNEFAESLGRPFALNALYHLPAGGFIGGSWAVILSLFSLGAWMLSQLVRQIRRRKINPSKPEANRG